MKYFHGIYSNNVEAVRTLIESGYDFEQRDRESNTPLITAVAFGNEHLAEIFIQAGANVNAANKIGWTALHSAAQNSLLKCCKLLLEVGASANVQDQYGKSPLFVAVMSKENIDVVKLLLAHGADPHLANKDNISPVQLADSLNRNDIIHCLSARREKGES